MDEITLGMFLVDARNEIDLTRKETCKHINKTAFDLVEMYLEEAGDVRGHTEPTDVVLTVDQLKRYERDEVSPSADILIRLSDLYDLDWEKLGTVLQHTAFEHSPKMKLVSSANKPETILGRPSSHKRNNARIQNGQIGEEIIKSELEDCGYMVRNMNDISTNHPNYDLEALKGGETIRIQVKSKRHSKKAHLCGSYDARKPSFNRSPTTSPLEKAQFLAMVRFTSISEYEIFWLSISEAEEKARWFGEEIMSLGNVPVQLQPYVSPTPRISRYKFNSHQVWAPYSRAWSKFKNKKKQTGATPLLNNIAVEDAQLAAPLNSKGWRDWTIVTIEGASPPGAEGTKRHKKNTLASSYAGKTVAEWIDAWGKIDPSYPITINNGRMCLEAGYFVLRTPDGVLVNELT